MEKKPELKLFKVESTNILQGGANYVLAKDLNDCLFKIRKDYESRDTISADSLFDQILKVELVAHRLVR